MKKRSFVAGAIIGGVISGVAVLLSAPQSGKKTRRKLQYKGEKVLHQARHCTQSLCKKSDGVKKKAEVAVLKAKDTLLP